MNTPAGITIPEHQHLHVQVRRVPMRKALEWLERGWTDLRQIGGAGLAHGALIAVLGAVLLMLGSTHLYLTAAAVTGYLLVGPVMTTGLCELARRREALEPVGFDESLQALARNPEGLLNFGAVLAFIALLWFALSAILLESVLSAPVPSLAVVLWGGSTLLTVTQALGYVGCGAVLAFIALLWFALSAILLESVLSAPVPSLAVVLWGGSTLLTVTQALGYVGCGAVLAAVVFAVSVVSVPLIIDRHASARDAIRASLRVTIANLPAMLLWAALIVAITAVGFLTLLVGMVIVAPLLGYATWHAYRDLIKAD
jgi:uncharacterized membrane protein